VTVSPGAGTGTAGDSQELLATADRLLREVVPGTRGVWPRTVAFVVRAALEQELVAFWQRCEPEVVAVPMRSQLLLLASYADAAVAREAAQVWGGLSRGCHHHAYELAPTAVELRGWLESVRGACSSLRRLPQARVASA
jgi:hypothetical protein